MIFLHIFQCHHFSFLIVILLFVIIPTYAHIRSMIVNVYVFQGTYLRCHWTVTPVPSPMTLIFPQLRWQEVSIVCTETRTLLSVSLFHLCEMKQGFFFSLFLNIWPWCTDAFFHRQLLRLRNTHWGLFSLSPGDCFLSSLISSGRLCHVAWQYDPRSLGQYNRPQQTHTGEKS